MSDERGTHLDAGIKQVKSYFSVLGIIGEVFLVPIVSYGVFLMGMDWIARLAATPFVHDADDVRIISFGWMIVSTILIGIPAYMLYYGMMRSRVEKE